jgi:hypothetical protein
VNVAKPVFTFYAVLNVKDRIYHGLDLRFQTVNRLDAASKGLNARCIQFVQRRIRLVAGVVAGQKLVFTCISIEA